MTQANIDFLEQNRDCHQEIINAQTATKANKIKADLLRIMREEFLPGYSFSDDCGSCLFDMTNLLYRRFDEWKAKNGPINPVPIENIKASFPSHKEPIDTDGAIPEFSSRSEKHHRK